MSGQGHSWVTMITLPSKMESGYGANEQVESGLPLPGAENMSGVTTVT